jgi:hypothetical protein
MRAANGSLQARDKLRVRKAAKWLGQGRPRRALRELQRLTRRAWKHTLTDRLVWRAAHELV